MGKAITRFLWYIDGSGNVKADTGKTVQYSTTQPVYTAGYTLTETSTLGVYKNDNVEAGSYYTFVDGVYKANYGQIWVGDDDMSDVYLDKIHTQSNIKGTKNFDDEVFMSSTGSMIVGVRATVRADGSDYLNNIVGYDSELIWQKYADARYSLSSHLHNQYASTGCTAGLAGLSSNNIWTGKNDFWGGLTGWLDNKRVAFWYPSSALPDTYVMGIDIYSTNSPNRINWNFTNTRIDSTGDAYFSNAKIPTSATKYITGVYANNDYVPKKYCTDNFQPLVNPSTWQPNMVIVDSTFADTNSTNLVQYYDTISHAINAIVINNADLGPTNVWTIVVREHKTSAGYVEDIEVPDYINIISEGAGKIYILGQLTRTGIASTITSILGNLWFLSPADTSQALDRFLFNGCIFTMDGTGDIVITKSRLMGDTGLYVDSGTIISGNNNKIISAFGNYTPTWGANDEIYFYSAIPGATFTSI